jgi:hypothetical protein
MTGSERFNEEILAPFLVLLLGKLTNWGDVIGGGGNQYLTGAQAEALAVEGVSLLARYLPREVAQTVTSAVEQLARPRHESREQALLQVGALGGVIPDGGDPGSPPGCCVFEPGRGLVCVR